MKARIKANRGLVLWACAALALAALSGCAHTRLRETLVPYQGKPLQDLHGLTFNGERFEARDNALEDGNGLARDSVEAIQFQFETSAKQAGVEAAAGEGLSAVAKERLARAQAMAQAYPGVAGVILVDDGEFVYRSDGTSLYRYHFAGLVLKEEKKGWAEFSAGFTEGRSRVRLLSARSVAPDGMVTTVAPEALEASSPSEEMEFFNPNRKVASAVIPGVEVGSVVEYAYEYETYNPEAPRLFFPGFYFQGAEPVVVSQVKVTVPKDIKFQYATRHFPENKQAPAVEETKGDITYAWRLDESPPLVPEPMMPPERDVVPMMEGSIFESFDEVFALMRGLQERRIQLTPEIQAKVTEITQAASDPDGKLALIYYWVQENTRYISIKGSLGAGWSGHSAQETFDNRYGDCTDKAILFATMCKALGVTAYPIILMTNDEGVGITEIPTLDANHAISEVVLGDRDFYLDTTAQDFRYPYFRPDDHGAFAINAIRGDIRQIPVPPPEDDSRASHLDVTLAPNGDLTVKTENKYTGPYEAGVRGFWKQVRDDDREARMAEYSNTISPGAVLESFRLSDLNDLSLPLTMGIDYALPQYAVRAGDLMYLRMPTLERDYPEVALDTRQFPIQYMTTEQRILDVSLALPKGFRVKWTPPPLDLTNPYLDYHAAYEEAGDTIHFKETFRRLQRIVPTNDYPAYRDALRAIAAFSKKEVFLTEEK